MKPETPKTADESLPKSAIALWVLVLAVIFYFLAKKRLEEIEYGPSNPQAQVSETSQSSKAKPKSASTKQGLEKLATAAFSNADGAHFAISPEEFRGHFNARINEERIKSIKVEHGEASDVFEVVPFDACRYIGAVHKNSGKVSQLMVIVRLPADFKDLPEDIAAQEIRNMVMAIVAPASVLSVMPESDIEESFVPAIYSVLASARKEVRVSVEDLQCLLTIQEGHLMSVLKPAASKEAPPTEADLENPKQALEKLATAAFSNANGIERFSVEPVGPDGKDYFVNISYKTKGSSLSEENSFKMIRIEMAEAYEKILAHSQIPINEIKINAQMMLRDKFGNEGWADVFRTRIQSEKITKVNRSNLKSVSFRSIWEPVFIHPIFFPFKDKANE